MTASAAKEGLLAELLARPESFDLFQAISLLEREGVARGFAELGADDGMEAVRLRSHVSLGFDSSDIYSAREGSETGAAFSLTTPVLSLAGQAGAMPAAFTEMLLERNAAKDFATADFLDIFQHRFLSLFYQGRKKHRLGLGWHSPTASSVARCTDALCALGFSPAVNPAVSPPATAANHVPWLRHAGLLGGAPRSMTGLTALLSDRFSLPVRGEQFVGGWHPLESDALTRLGSAHRSPVLGQTATLGRTYWDQAAGIRLSSNALTLSRLQSLVPGGREHADFSATVRRYLPSDTRVEVVLTPAPDAMPASRLSAHAGLKLGWTAWLTGTAPGRQPLAAARFRLQAGSHE